MQIDKEVITETTTTIKLAPYDIMRMLVSAGYVDNSVLMHPNYDVHVRVPGGGDWSNTNLTIDGDHPVVVTVKTKKEETT